MLELMKVTVLRELAHGMPHRSEARKHELIAWLRKYRPEVEREACKDFYPGAAYADVCGNCGLHISQH